MAMNVQWRWNMPTVGDPNANADDMAQGIQALGEGFGRLIGGNMKWERDKAIRDLAQSNWERNFAQQQAQSNRNYELQKAQSDRNYELQRDQYELTKKAKEAEMERQRIQDEWLKQFYEQYFGNDPEVTELQKLLAKYQRPTDNSMFMAGLNPLLMK